MSETPFTPTTNVKAIPTIIAQGVISKLPGYMNLARTVAKDTDFEGAFNVGDTLNITKTGALTAKQKTPGSAIETQAPTATDVSVTLNQHWYISFLQEDITKMLQKPDMQASYADDAAIALAEKIEGVLLALHPSMTNTVTFDGTSATTIDASLMLMRSWFAKKKVPAATPKYAYLNTTVIDKLLAVDKYASIQYNDSKDALVEGAVKRLYGINIFESQLVPTSGSPVCYHNVAYTRNGLILATRPMPLDGNGMGARQRLFNDPNTGISLRLTESYDDDYLGVKMTMDVLFGVNILNNDFVVEVESF
jgi:hypothetical protein